MLVKQSKKSKSTLTMELQQLKTFPFILTFILFLLTLVRQSKKSKSTPSSLPLPPGPFKLPLIGHLHLLSDHLHQKLNDLAKIYGPVVYVKLGKISTVVISSSDVTEKIMKTHDLKFVDRAHNLASKVASYECKDVAGAPYGDYWRQVKKLCVLELLSVKKVQSCWSVREEEVSKLVRRITLMDGSQINLSEMIFTLINDIVARATFGKTCKDKETFMSVTEDIVYSVAGFSIADLYSSLKFLEIVSGHKSKMNMMHQKQDKILDDIIREHKDKRMETFEAEVEEDVVDVLLRILESPELLELPIPIDNAKALIFDMFGAGTHTSSTTIEWTFTELLRNPSVMEKAQKEVRKILFDGEKKIDQADMDKLSYLRLVIKESLRLHPPAPFLLPRECRERCEIEGYEIPKGSRVLVNAWAIGRDSENWKNPENFEPERFQDLPIDYKGNNFNYIPFGSGRRMCPGISFGVANVELPLALLLYHFDWKLANGAKPEELDMTGVGSSVYKLKENLHVIPTIYKPA